jgi:hypothetical protein
MILAVVRRADVIPAVQKTQDWVNLVADIESFRLSRAAPEEATKPVSAIPLRHESRGFAEAGRDRGGWSDGGKPGSGGMLPGQKITDRVAAIGTLPKGINQRSASRHPDRTRPDDLEIKITFSTFSLLEQSVHFTSERISSPTWLWPAMEQISGTGHLTSTSRVSAVPRRSEI